VTDPESAPESSGTAPAVESRATDLRLTDYQLTLRRVLSERDQTAEALYIGALRVLADAGNPDRMALAAHGLRELIRDLPRYFNLPVLVRARMGDKVNALHGAWDKARPTLQLDQPLPPALWRKLEAFFEWYESERPTHRQKTAELLLGLDPAARPLPKPIAQLRADEWLACQDFFVGSAHHGSCTEDELRQWLDSFERFVLDLVRPRTFDNADALDALIAEGEGDG
jgi:hypothetical protein